MKIIVAIDGCAASGKSTIAQDLAEKTGRGLASCVHDVILNSSEFKRLCKIIKNLLVILQCN